MSIFLDIDTVKVVIAYIFLLIIIISFGKYYIFLKEINNYNIQRIIGGLSVFLIAIIANNSWIFSLSIFVGGLIIASEEFMKSLAAILKSDKKNVGNTIRALDQSKTASEEVGNEEIIKRINDIYVNENTEEIKKSPQSE